MIICSSSSGGSVRIRHLEDISGPNHTWGRVENRGQASVLSNSDILDALQHKAINFGSPERFVFQVSQSSERCLSGVGALNKEYHSGAVCPKKDRQLLLLRIFQLFIYVTIDLRKLMDHLYHMPIANNDYAVP